MNVLWSIVGAGLLGGMILLHLHAIYSIALGLLSLLVPRRRSDQEESTPRIAVLIVAHDEEKVISGSVASLVEQDYPRDRFEVFVVADNCSDATAERASAAGARVLERKTGQASGKSAALEFGISRVASERDFDAVAVFDADNVASPRFLRAIGARLADGEQVVQGFVDAQNPDASWVAASSALGFWSIAGFAQAPRERLQLSAPLMGTAWAATLETIEPAMNSAESLTDDLELGARLALRGTRVAFERRASAVDEKPTRLGDAYTQRHRWMQGRWQVVRRYFLPLLWRSVGARPPDATRGFGPRLRAFDVAVQLATPSLLFSAVVLGVVSGGLWAVAEWLPPATMVVVRTVPLEVSVTAALVYYLVPAPAIFSYSRGARVWLFYLVQPGYLLLSVPLGLSGLFRRRTNWQRTRHGDTSS